MFSLISKLIIIAAVIGCIISIIITQSSLAEMQKELNSIVMKKLAIEDMNYAYPDERRYYDTSRN